MKKLLSLLGAIVIAASASQSVVSFSYGPSMKKFVKKEVKFYSEVSAEALKAGILADQNLNIQTAKGAGLDLDFASNTLGGQRILSRFADLIDPNQGAKPSSTAEVSSLYQTVFGTTQGGFHYTIKNSFDSLNHVGGVKAGTTLAKLVSGKTEDDISKDTEAPKTFKQPDSGTATTLNMIAGIANIVFKNDFSPSMAATVIGLLTSNTVRNLFTGDSGPMIKNIIDTVDTVTTNYTDEIDLALDAITQANAAQAAIENNYTYKDKLELSTKELFKGLIYFLSPTNDKGEKYKYVAGDAPSIFWQMITNQVKADDLVAAGKLTTAKNFMKADDTDPTKQVIDIESLNDLISSAAQIVDFGITLLHYFRAFDEYFAKQPSPANGFNVFSGDKTNKDVISYVLEKRYVDTLKTDDFWYVEKKENADKTTYTTKLNLQNLISDLEYCLIPRGSDDKHPDKNGYSLLRPLTILLGGTDEGFNPILKTAFDPVFDTNSGDGILWGLISKFIDDKIPSIPVVMDDTEKAGAKLALINIARLLASRQVVDFLASDGDDPDSTFVSSLFEQLSDLAKAVNITDIIGRITGKDKPLDAKTIAILSLVDAGLSYLTGDGKKLLKHPWSTIYSGNFLSGVANALNSIKSNSLVKDALDNIKMPNLLTNIANMLRSLRDVKTILKKPIGDIVNGVNVLLSSLGQGSFNLPDWLYNARDKSISDLITYLGQTWLSHDDISNKKDVWSTNAFNTIKQNNRYAFNTGAIVELLRALLPNKNNDKNLLTVKDGSGAIVSPLKPIYYAIKYFSRENPITESEEKGLYDAKSYTVSSPSINDDKPVEIINAEKGADGGKTIISTNALEDLLGVKKEGIKYEFIKYTLLGSLSRIYGHNYLTNEGKESPDYTEMFNGSSSLFALFTAFSRFAVDSVAALTRDDYSKYFDPKQWDVRNARQTNLDNDRPTYDTVQTLDYDLVFHNPDDGRSYTYHVAMHRKAADMGNSGGNATTGWIVDKLYLQ